MTEQANPVQPDEHATNKAKHAAGRAALADLVAPVRWQLLIGRILAGVSALLSVVPYLAIVMLGDALLEAWQTGTSPDQHRIDQALMILVSAFLGRLFIYTVALVVTHVADVKLVASIRRRIVTTISRAPLSWFSELTSGRVRKAIQDDVTTLHMLVAHKPVDATVAVISPLALGTYAFVIDWRLGLLAVGVIPVYLIVYAVMMSGITETTAAFDTQQSELSAAMVEFVFGINVVKAFGIAGQAHARYAAQASKTADFYERWNRPMFRGSAITMGIISAPMVLFINLLGGSLLVYAGHVSPVEVIVTSLIALVLPSGIQVLATSVWSYQLAGNAALRIIETLQSPTLSTATAPAQLGTPEVIFEDATLCYGQTKAVDGVALRLKPGTVTALVGASGSGKSSLAKLAARFYDTDSGRVLIGGVDIRDIPEEQLYTTVSFVLQEAMLVRASIRDNIALARPDATPEQIQQVARLANIHDEIQAMPEGYDTMVGGQTRLSGGQEQRIAIARALLADTQILILDEATAMMDPECEAEVQGALTRLAKGRTVLVIAHRPSSIVGADQIVVMDHGQVVASGRHNEVLHHPRYAQIWDEATAVKGALR